MALPLLPILGAGLGGIQAYRQSGGDIGATLLGSGLGAITPGALRMAGTALGGTALGARALGGLSTLGQGAMKSGLGKQVARAGVNLPAGPLAPLTAAGLGAAAAGTGVFLGAPGIAGNIAAGLGSPARTAVSGTAGLMGTPGAGPAQYGGAALPPGMNQFGYVDPYGNPLDIVNPAGLAAGRRAEFQKIIEQERDAMRILNPEIFQASEAARKADMQRQLAAAGVRRNIDTAANMLERSQDAALRMGATAASQAGSALTQQYQYQ